MLCNGTVKAVPEYVIKTYVGILILTVYGGNSQLHAPITLLPGKATPLPVEEDPGWAPQPVWVLWRRQDKQCTYIVTLRRVHATIAAVEKH